MTDFDVAIVGGGPAGAAAALTLLRYSKLRPVVIERSSYEEWRVGETLAPGVLPLLDYLGANDVLDPREQLRAYGTSAAWGSADVVSRAFLFAGAGDAWHLDRRRFDEALAELVRERGGTLLTNAIVESESRVDGRWQLQLHDGTAIAAPFVIDASGRHATFARRRGAHAEIVDHLTGLLGIFDGEDGGDASTLVESFEDGWWYSARLPDGKLVAALMADADAIRAGRLHERDAWHERLGSTHATRARVRRRRLTHDPFVCPAHSQMLTPAAGDGWLAAGDAGLAVDPLSSMGIGYAIASGIQAARVASAPSPEMLQAYAADLRRHFDGYLARRAAYYAIERRWPEAEFWKRRRITAGAAAPPLVPPR
jgi:flavin-dependent dehydrogenase